MTRLFVVVCLFWASAGLADTVVAARTLPARAILAPQDVRLIEGQMPGMAERVEQIVGLETGRILYAGQPVALSNLNAPALVERNAIVTLVFAQGSLRIVTEGRALGRASAGETVSALNLGSRITVAGRVSGPSEINVGQQPTGGNP